MNKKMFPHGFNSRELYNGLNPKLLKGRWVKNRYKDRKNLAAKIFDDCFYEILLDIINNNVTFVLPLRFGNYGEISMKLQMKTLNKHIEEVNLIILILYYLNLQETS
jgi:hypothetical protein